MPVCAVPTCSTTHRATDKTLYRFPKDINYARLWIRCCMRRDSFNTKTAFICSLHFADEAYQRDINHDVLGFSSKKNLRKDAVPTLLLPSLRMFSNEMIEAHKYSLFMDEIPTLSPSSFSKNFRLDFFSCPRINKGRVKLHQSYMKNRSSTISLDNPPDTPYYISNGKEDIVVECVQNTEVPSSVPKEKSSNEEKM